MSFFTEIEKSVLKLIQKHKIHQIARFILSRKKNAGGTGLEIILNSHSNKNNIALAQKQTKTNGTEWKT
jgi:hypothetical protein